jgi:hypothetical protein
VLSITASWGSVALCYASVLGATCDEKVIQPALHTLFSILELINDAFNCSDYKHYIYSKN